MKNKTLKLFTILLVILTFSCGKYEPFIHETLQQNTNKTEPEKTPEPEKEPEAISVLMNAGNKCELLEHVSRGDATVFSFETEKEEWKTITIQNKYIKAIEDKEFECNVTFYNDKKTTLRLSTSIALSLEDNTVAYGYPGDIVDIPFTVTKKGFGYETIKFQTSRNASIKEYNTETGEGTISVITRDQMGAERDEWVNIYNGRSAKNYDIKTHSYSFKLTAEDITLDGEQKSTATVSYCVETDVPDYQIILALDDETLFEIDDNAIIAKEDNKTGDERSVTLHLSETSGKFPETTCTVTQVSLLPTNPEGCVPFTDWAFKKACVEIADTNSDGEVSFDEASVIKELNISNKGIKNLDGIEYFNHIEKLDCSYNKINRFDFSDPGTFAALKDLNLYKNETGDRYTLNINGCYVGTNFSYVDINGTSNTGYSDRPKYYESTDFSYNGNELLYKHSKGKGIVIQLISVGLLDVDYAAGAGYDIANAYIDKLFSYEPFASLKEYFDIYLVKSVAPNTEYDGHRDYIQYTVEPFTSSKKFTIDCFITQIQNNHEINTTVAMGGLPDDPWRAYASCGFPQDAIIHLGNKRRTFPSKPDYTITHEFGHAVGKLADQYVEGNKKAGNSYNSSKTSDPEKVPWKQFFQIENYTGRVGIYENKRGYFPSPKSIMAGDTDYFDSPSRWGIYANTIMAGNMEGFDTESLDKDAIWQQFLEYDIINNDIPY